MTRPRIYGSETNYRNAIARYIKSCDDLIDQAEGVRKRVLDAGPLAEFELIASGWPDSVERWRVNARHNLQKYLQEQTETKLPVLSAPLPKSSDQMKLGKRRERTELEVLVPWLGTARAELERLLGMLGVKRSIVSVSDESLRFAELHASGLVEDAVVRDHARDMASPRTPKQLAVAIAAAKELTEATLRAALEQIGEPVPPNAYLPALMKRWRQAIELKAPPGPEGKDALDKAQAALANLITFLAEWRNPYGRGHGRPTYPKGLKPRHARLATDASETCIRFIVWTMDDLELLPRPNG